MLQKLILSALWFTSVVLLGLEPLYAQMDLSQVTSARHYHVANGVVIGNASVPLTKLIVILPLAQTNNYQQVNRVITNGGEILAIPETDDHYIRYTVTGSDLPLPGWTKVYGYELDVTLYGITVALDRITTIYPYDRSSDIFRWYTGASGVYVDPDNPLIQSLEDYAIAIPIEKV